MDSASKNSLAEIFDFPHVFSKCKETALEKLWDLAQAGPEQLHVLTDFDYTLTRSHDINGVKTWTSHGVFDHCEIPLAVQLRGGLTKLKDYYYPIEINPELSSEEKLPYMIEWWAKAHDLIIAAKISKNDLEKLITTANIILRDGAIEFMNLLHSSGIPMMIFSAGVGDYIEMFLRHAFKSKIPDSVHIISNFMQFDENGTVVGFKDPLIHTFNKNSEALVSVESQRFLETLKKRSQVLLMGDMLGDASMDTGELNEANIVRIGFLNHQDDRMLQKYLEHFDIVIQSDQTMQIPRIILDTLLKF